MSLFFGRETRELKERMKKIIAAEEETCKTMKLDIKKKQELIEAINKHREVMEKILEKL